MPLKPRDRIFLADFVQFNWMHRVLAAHALALAGAGPEPFAIKSLKLYYPGKTVEELTKIAQECNESARVQAVMVARILTEYVAALEDTGAFVRAVGRWNSSHGILRSNFDYQVREIREFYDDVLGTKRTNLPALLHLPALSQVRKLRGTPLYADLRAHYPGIAKRLRQAARSYRKVGRSRVYALNTGRLHRDYQHYVHALVDIRAAGTPPPPRPGGVFDRTYNKIKHGFNVLESVERYVKLPRTPDRIEVVKLSRQWPSVKKLIENVDALGVLCNRLATLVARLDEEGFLP